MQNDVRCTDRATSTVTGAGQSRVTQTPRWRFTSSRPISTWHPSNGNAESVARSPEDQAIGIGREGSTRNVQNLFSAIDDFGLDLGTALEIFEDVRRTVADWRSVFYAGGVTQRDQALVAHRILNPMLNFGKEKRQNPLIG